MGVLAFRLAGGGDFGDPLERDIKRIQDDLDDGYITPDAVRELYRRSVRHDADRAERPWVVG